MPSQCHGQKMPFDIPRGMIIGLSIYVGILTMVVYKSRFLWMLVGWSFPLKKIQVSNIWIWNACYSEYDEYIYILIEILYNIRIACNMCSIYIVSIQKYR
jgi:hypothetical protein